MKSKSSLFLIIIVVVLIAGGLIYYFSSKGESSSLPTSTLVSTNTGNGTGTAVATTGSRTGDQVVSLLRNLSVIQLNDAIFQNPSFTNLQDISINLAPVTNQGRRNPFAVVGTDNPAAAVPVSAAVTNTTPSPTTGSGAVIPSMGQ